MINKLENLFCRSSCFSFPLLDPTSQHTSPMTMRMLRPVRPQIVSTRAAAVLLPCVRPALPASCRCKSDHRQPKNEYREVQRALQDKFQNRQKKHRPSKQAKRAKREYVDAGAEAEFRKNYLPLGYNGYAPSYKSGKAIPNTWPRPKNQEFLPLDEQELWDIRWKNSEESTKNPKGRDPVATRPDRKSKKQPKLYHGTITRKPDLEEKSYLDWEKEKRQSLENPATSEKNEDLFNKLLDYEVTKNIENMRKDPSDSRVQSRYNYSAKGVERAVNPEEISMEAVESQVEQPAAPHLHHGLDRALFSPGVHVLKDQRTNVYNFPPYLESVMSIRDFDFSHVPAFVSPAQDTQLSKIAHEHKKTFTASTSSLTSVLTHLHFLISRNRLPSGDSLSGSFKDCPVDFSFSAKKPVSMFLNYHPETETYSLDSDKTQDEEIILSLLGQVLEAKLTVSNEEFQLYGKSDEPTKVAPEIPRSTYHYSTCGDFVMRSQIDCHDPRLPGTGVFDLKTRAVCAVRHDIDYAQIRDGSDYQISNQNGLYESYEREMYDLIRATMLKYSLQARIGRMDGIFLAYHNIKKMFGFQYLPLEEMDRVFHSVGFPAGADYKDVGTQASLVADQEFKISMKILSDLLTDVIEKHPKQSFNIIFKSPVSPAESESQGPAMRAIFNPMPSSAIKQLQKGIPFDAPPIPSVQDAYSKKKSVKTRAYLESRTLIQICEDQYIGLLPGCFGYLVDVENHIDGKKLPNSIHPAPSEGEKWTVSSTVSEIAPQDLPFHLETVYRSLESFNKVPASVIAATETLNDGTTDTVPNNGSGRLTSRPDTVQRSQEEIADLVEKKLANLGKPTKTQRLLRAYDVKGRLAELAHQKLHGDAEPVVWKPITSESSSV